MESPVRHFAPGPSHLYPGVALWAHEALKNGIASLSHRSEHYSAIHGATVQELRLLLNVPDDYQIFFLSSATEAMERIIQNCVEQHSYHLVNGSFSKRFMVMARELGKQTAALEQPHGESFTPDMLVIPKSAELAAIVHSETSTGVMTPLETIYEVKKLRPDMLVAVDIVSSAPIADLDLSQVDMAFFSVQKGFGLPAGLGVLIVSPAALQKAHNLRKQGVITGTYHNFDELHIFAERSQTPETPNVLGIYLLGKVAADMNRRGMQSLLQETDAKLALLHRAVKEHPELAHFVPVPTHRSRTVVTIKMNHNAAMLAYLRSHGFVVGEGYGSEYRQQHLRISNFPALTVADVEALVGLLLKSPR